MKKSQGTRKSKPARRPTRKPTSKATTPDADEGIIESAPPQKEPPCVVVGVGASAGGLEAFTELLRPFPKKPGMAFVLIMHLDPKHESAMTELLGRSVAIEVKQVHDGM